VVSVVVVLVGGTVVAVVVVVLVGGTVVAVVVVVLVGGTVVVVVVGGGLGFVVVVDVGGSVVVVGGTVVVVVVGNGSGSGKSSIGVPEVVVVVELPEGWVSEDWVEMTLGSVVTFPGFVVDVVEREAVVGVDDFGLKIRILGTTVVVVAALGAPVVVGELVPGLAGFVVGGGVATVVVGTAAVSDGWLTEWNGPLR
jgi:hypothetical protein